MSNGIVKFNAELTLLTESEGGRQTPVRSGFRTDMKFREGFRIVAIEFEKELMFPGESNSVVCNALLHSEEEIDFLLSNSLTHIADGASVIGNVKIRNVIDREGIDWKA